MRQYKDTQDAVEKKVYKTSEAGVGVGVGGEVGGGGGCTQCAKVVHGRRSGVWWRGRETRRRRVS